MSTIILRRATTTTDLGVHDYVQDGTVFEFSKEQINDINSKPKEKQESYAFSLIPKLISNSPSPGLK